MTKTTNMHNFSKYIPEPKKPLPESDLEIGAKRIQDLCEGFPGITFHKDGVLHESGWGVMVKKDRDNTGFSYYVYNLFWPKWCVNFGNAIEYFGKRLSMEGYLPDGNRIPQTEKEEDKNKGFWATLREYIIN